MKKSLIEETANRTGLPKEMVSKVIRHFFSALKDYSKMNYPVRITRAFTLLINKRLFKKLQQFNYMKNKEK